jgi:competence protein ComEA
MKRSSTRSTVFLSGLIALIVSGLCSCYRLPRKAVAGSSSQTNLSGPQVETQLKLNSATSEELQQLPGIGVVLAERIVAHRNKYGPFRRVEHLMVVRGISERKFRDLRHMLVAE